MEQRHPVSVLQELLAKQYKPLPVYEIVNVSQGIIPQFQCKVTVGDVASYATCSSKQMAKRNAAAAALNALGYTSFTVVTSAVSKKREIDASIVNYNAIGKLNEFTAKRKTCAPVYEECGMEENEFVIKCKLGEKVTDGRAPVKKVAKQIAAFNMLKHLENTGSLYILGSPRIPVPDFVSDESVVEKFVELSISPKKPSPQKNTLCIINVKDENGTEHDGLDIKEPPANLQDILDELKEMDVAYQVDIMSKDPFVFLLKFENEHNTTVVETGTTYQETYLKLFQSALKVIQALKMVKH